ncbi:MAG TPA: hypothetical protein VNT57_01980, partial [Desulfobacteria bacterium]|nr:hypothetical protein [Desulfobacteria bacterium]
MPKLGFRISIRVKFIILVVTLIIALTMLIGYLSYNKAAEALEDELGRTLTAVAGTGVLMIDGDLHDKLKTPADEQTETYRELKKKLQQIRDANKATYVYTFAPKNE